MEEKKNYFIEQINENDLMSVKHKNVCTPSNYIKHLF